MSREDCKNFWDQFDSKIKTLNENFEFYEFPIDSNSYFSGKVNDNTTGSTGRPFIGVDLVNRDGFIRVNVYIPNDKKFYDGLFEERDKTEKVYGDKLKWARECGKKASRVFVEITGLNFKRTGNYDLLMSKLIETIKRFIIAFEKQIRN